MEGVSKKLLLFHERVTQSGTGGKGGSRAIVLTENGQCRGLAVIMMNSYQHRPFTWWQQGPVMKGAEMHGSAVPDAG